MIKFEKVSFEEWKKTIDKLGWSWADDSYKRIILPKRATIGSAGYDFYSAYSHTIEPGETYKMPTGIRCKMDKDIVLMIYIRSSIGFKYQTTLDNNVGIIDSDYYNSDNEGHIMIKVTNHGNDNLKIEAGDAICQGIFTHYLLTDDDSADGIRNGGIGSTSGC